MCFNESDDLRVMYFPFLITALILTIMVFFGKLKRKGVLIDGEKKYISNQWSIVTIIALVSIVLFLAVFTQFCLALYYFSAITFVLTMLILIAMIVFNIVWIVWYLKNFHKARKPAIGERVTVKGRTLEISTEKQQNDPKYQIPVD